MSQENVEIVRRMYDAFHAGDVERALSHFDPNVAGRRVQRAAPSRHRQGARVCERGRHAVGWPPGRNGVRRSRRCVTSASRVLVLSVQRGRGKGSGVEVEARYAMLYDLHGDAIIGMRMYGKVARGPRSRRAAGVGDVAGERGDRCGGCGMRGRRGTFRPPFRSMTQTLNGMEPTFRTATLLGAMRQSWTTSGAGRTSGTTGPSRSSESSTQGASRWCSSCGNGGGARAGWTWMSVTQSCTPVEMAR